MPVRISVKLHTRELQRSLTRLAQTQLPFATAMAINQVTDKIVEAETQAIGEVFDQPRAFTKGAFTTSKSFGGQRASKRDFKAIIVAKPVQERYLAPSEFNEPQSLGQGKRIRTPVEIKTGVGGNIPAGSIAKLLASPDVFMGEVGGINGIWQRPTPKRPRVKGAPRRTIKANNTDRLRLLVAFTRPVKVKTKLDFHERADGIVMRHWRSAFDRSIARAIATA